MAVEIRTEGRRHYLIGLPYGSYRDKGANWDPERKLWWTGKRELAEALARDLPAAPRKSESAIVAGKALYKGRTYYVAGRTERGRTAYDDRVMPVRTQDGARYLLMFTDGSSQFWADAALCSITTHYERPRTIGALQSYAAQERNGRTRQDFEQDCDLLEDNGNFEAAERQRTAGYGAWRRG